MYLYKHGNRGNFWDQRETYEEKYPLIIPQPQPNPCHEGTGNSTKPNYFFKRNGAEGDFFVMYTGQYCSDVGDNWRKQIFSILIAPKTKVLLCQDNNCGLSSRQDNGRSDRWRFLNINYPTVAIITENR
jgi:hypothetical protein